MMALIAVVVAATLAYSYVGTQSTSIAIARNIMEHTRARYAAESALVAFMAAIKLNQNWRDDLPKDGQGKGIVQTSIGGTPAQLVVQDGYDADGNGTIDPGEGDGDLTDDTADPFSVTATGQYGDSSGQVRAVVTPSGAGCEEPSEPKTVLFVVPNASNLATCDTDKKTLMESWGYVVEPISANSSQSSLDAAAAEADVVYISETISSSEVNTKLRNTPIGVVSEEGYLNDDFRLATSQGPAYSDNQIKITDNNHYITSTLELGVLTLTSSTQSLRRITGTLAPGLSVLATRDSNNDPTLAVIDTGDKLTDGRGAAARRVILPYGDNGFDVNGLTASGRTIVERSLEWASQPAPIPDPVVHYDFDSQSGTAVVDRERDTDDDGDEDSDDVIVDLHIEPGDGTVAWVTDTEAGTGLYFDQNSQSGTAVAKTTNINVADKLKEAMKDSDALTIQAFIKAEGFDNSGGRIISYSRDTHSHHGNVTLMGDNDGSNNVDLISRVKNSHNVDEYKQNNVFQLNTLHVLAFTVDHNLDSDNIKLYVDGVLVRTSSRSHRDFNSWTSEHFMLGNELTLDRPFRGTLFDIKVWDQALSETHMLANAKALLPGEGEQAAQPQLIALYEFDEVLSTAQLIAHWKLDEVPGAGPGLAVSDAIEVKNDGVIDSFDSTQGPYGGDNVGDAAWIATNATYNNKIVVRDDGVVNGSAYAGPGGNPSSVIRVQGHGEITGETGALSEVVSIPTPSTPSMGPNVGDTKYQSGITTLSSDLHCNKFEITGSAIVQISGDVVIVAEKDVKIKNSAQLRLLTGATLTLYSKKKLDLESNAQINMNTADPTRLMIYHLGNGNGNSVELKLNARMYATLTAPYTVFKINDDAQFYGTFLGQTASVEVRGKFHQDVRGGGGSPTVAAEEVAGNNGAYANGVSVGESGCGDGGTAARFDGHNDYVAIPHADGYLLNNGAVSLWFNSDNLSGHRGLFSKDSSNYDNGGHLHIYTDGSRVKARLQSTTNSYTLQSSSGLQTDTWYHVVINFGVGGMRLYLNGSLVDSDCYSGGMGTSSGGSGNREPIALGSNTWGSGNEVITPLSDYFAGRIDDVKIYNDALDANQIGNLYAGHSIGSPGGPGVTVEDTSEYGLPLNLNIMDPGDVSWIPGGGLTMTHSTKITSCQPATKLYDALTATNEISLEVIFTPANVTQDGPAQIVSFSRDTSHQNFVFGQDDEKYVQRLRTSSTGSTGMPTIESDDVLEGGVQDHVVVTFDGDDVKMYRRVGGELELEVTESRTGTFSSSWDTSHLLLMANSNTDSRPWLGTLHRIAVYDRSLSECVVGGVFDGLSTEVAAEQCGTDCTFQYAVRWISGP